LAKDTINNNRKFKLDNRGYAGVMAYQTMRGDRQGYYDL